MIKKANSPQSDKTRRRRRKPEAAESEILHAAENFLRELPFHEMTVDNVMARTGLSRPSFYEYFRSRSHLMIKLAERLAAQNRVLSARWFVAPDPVAGLRHSTREIVEWYVAHGHLLRALADAAQSDEQVDLSYRAMFEVVIDATARRIREFVADGSTSLPGLDAREIASALLWMNERFMIERLGRRPQADPQVVVDTLVSIWWRVLHGGAR